MKHQSQLRSGNEEEALLKVVPQRMSPTTCGTTLSSRKALVKAIINDVLVDTI